METKYTKGNWALGNAKSCVVTNAEPELNSSDTKESILYYGGVLICESCSEANAKLIAAAPDLLEALMFAVEREESDRDFVRSVTGGKSNTKLPWVIKAEAAIAKATEI